MLRDGISLGEFEGLELSVGISVFVGRLDGSLLGEPDGAELSVGVSLFDGELEG